MQKLFEKAQEQLQIAQQNRHRLLITLSGEQLWAESLADKLLRYLALEALWVSDNPVTRTDSVDQNSSRRWLGREVDHLVFDARSGLDPNVFSLLCGTVRAGGTFILLTPALDTWKHHSDPVNLRCSVWGAEVLTSRYLARLARLLPHHSQLLLQQSSDLALNAISPMTCPISQGHEQEAIVENIVDRFLATADVLLEVICGDRGRGKSAALGRLAAELARHNVHKILITAPRKAATDVLLQHAREHWPADAPPIEQCLCFAPPDQLSLNPQICDALLVDEMGGIHLGLLQKILAHYPKLIMAGTVHGYEGAGRGFHTRLRRHITHTYSHCQWHQLDHPMRWASEDPLETAASALMLLDAEPKLPAEGELDYRFIDRDLLAADENLLRQVHGLLASAHYRTRPLDLRQMLDGPNIRVAVGEANHEVVSACLIAVEGPMSDADLNHNIVAGKRRPAGHLLPQLLMQRLQLIGAAPLCFWRIVRIAVHPTRQSRGLGRAFLAFVERQAAQENVDCLGSLFAVDLRVLLFWQGAGYQPVALGDNCEATSGSYALTILKPLSAPSAAIASKAAKAWRDSHTDALVDSHPALPQALCDALSDTLYSDAASNDANMGG